MNEYMGEGKGKIIAALAAVYLSWGSTYLAIRIALDELPPLFLMGIRFFVFGTGIYVFLRMRGAPNPTFREWSWSLVIGTFLMLGGSASVAYAEQWVSSGLAALMIATTPLWIVLFAGIWKRWPNRIEWLGLVTGLATSYAYVNPVIAVLLGMWLLGERIHTTGVIAMAIILSGVVLVVLGQMRSRKGSRQ
jgi:drug/metabolite transporter (DMT)-like permease